MLAGSQLPNTDVTESNQHVRQDTHGVGKIHMVSGKIHMVPALINDDYVIRFAVCAHHAVDDDVAFAWSVISEMATDVLAMCDTNKE